MSEKWKVTIHAFALDKLKRLKAEKPHCFEALCTVMDLLAIEDDPRQPANPCLNVCAIEHDAPGWFRVRTLTQNYRIVFRVLELTDHRVIEVHPDTPLGDPVDQRAIQITAAQPRSASYGVALKQLWKKAS